MGKVLQLAWLVMFAEWCRGLFCVHSIEAFLARYQPHIATRTLLVHTFTHASTVTSIFSMVSTLFLFPLLFPLICLSTQLSPVSWLFHTPTGHSKSLPVPHFDSVHIVFDCGRKLLLHFLFCWICLVWVQELEFKKLGGQSVKAAQKVSGNEILNRCWCWYIKRIRLR